MKKNYRAHLSLALAAVLALSLTACGPKDDTDASKSDPAGSGSASASQSQSDAGGSTSQKEDPVPTPDPTPAPSPAEESLDAIRMEMEPSGAIAGIFFLGVHDGEPLDDAFYTDADRQGYFEGRPFMKEITMDQYARNVGSEVYCIVPADPNAKVKVTAWDEAGEKPVEGDVLYESENGAPFFVHGNASDIMPNLSITITDSFGNTLEKYHPCISLKDGTVNLPADDQPMVLDMTGSMTAVDPYAN